MKVKLKPCPFCGKRAKIKEFKMYAAIPQFGCKYVACECGAGNYLMGFPSDEAAAKHWNSRQND